MRINPEALRNAIKQLQEGKFGIVDAKDFDLPGFNTKPIEGYTPPENFPNCCDTHKQLYLRAEKLYTDFPNCCEEHKKLNNAVWFDKSDYKGLPEKIINTISYTEYHITQQINDPDWHNDIIEYLEYSKMSFGSIRLGYGSPVGLSLYLNYMKNWIEAAPVIPPEKKIVLKEYFDSSPKETLNVELADFNILLDTYRRWLKVFPFSISFFANLKDRFTKSLPLLSTPPIPNRYSGTATAKAITHKGLIEYLVNITKEILKTINTNELVTQGSITESQKIEIISEHHRIKTSALLETYTKGEKGYLKIIKEWLANEKDYLKEITPYLHHITAKKPQPSNNIPLTLDEITKAENKFWKGIPMEEVITHFKVLTERKSKNGKPFLTTNQFLLFLERGFLGNTNLPKQRINLTNGEKGLVIKRFYEFFDLAVSQYSELNKKFKYVKLISNCFDNWDEKSIEPFFKPNKTKEKW